MSRRPNKKGGNKNKEVAKVETINGLVCLYDKSEAEVVEHEDNFVMNISLRDGQYAERSQTLFLFDQHAKRMCGIFEAVSVEPEAELSYKIHVHVQKRCLPIEGPELAKLVKECGLKLQGCPEPLTAKQVRELVYSFRTLTDSRAPPPPETRVYSTGYMDGGVEALYSDSYLQRPPQRYLPPQAGYPDYCPGDNHVPDGGYVRGTHRMSMKVPEQVPVTYAQMAPVTAVDCLRSTSPGLLVCPPEGYGVGYGHPVTSEVVAYERQARGPGVTYGTSPLDYAAEGIPASRVPAFKKGNEIGQSGAPAVDSVHKKPERNKFEPPPPAVPKSREENAQSAKGKPVSGKRALSKCQLTLPCNKSRKRQVAMQGGQNSNGQSKKVTVFDRLSRKSVWNRIVQQQPQQQRQQQLQQPQERKRARENDGSGETGKMHVEVAEEPAEASISVEDNCDFKRRSQRSPENNVQEEPRLKGRRFVRPRMDGEAEDCVKN